jgi:hypothetical protein
VFDRPFQTDARAKPARPDDGVASDGLERISTRLWCFDRPFQTDARAKPARPDDGVASDASARRFPQIPNGEREKPERDSAGGYNDDDEPAVRVQGLSARSGYPCERDRQEQEKRTERGPRRGRCHAGTLLSVGTCHSPELARRDGARVGTSTRPEPQPRSPREVSRPSDPSLSRLILLDGDGNDNDLIVQSSAALGLVRSSRWRPLESAIAADTIDRQPLGA